MNYRFKLIQYLFLFILCTLSSAISLPSMQLSQHNVNVLDGTYVEINEDITVPGPMPFVVQRVYGIEIEPDEWSYPLGNGWFWVIQAPSKNNTTPLRIITKTDDHNRLKSIQVVSLSSKEPYSSLDFHYEKNTLTLQTHLGMQWFFQFDDQNRILQIRSPGQENIYYQYEQNQIIRRSTSSGHVLLNELYKQGHRKGKVKSQMTMTEKGKKLQTLMQYDYDLNKREVTNSDGVKKIYTFDPDLQKVKTIETNLGKKKIRKEKFTWTLAPIPKLQSWSVHNEKEKCQYCKTYVYDSNGFIIRETIFGNLSGACKAQLILNESGLPKENGIEKYTIYRKYSLTPKHLLLEEKEDNGHFVRYEYDESSSLLIKKWEGVGNNVESSVLFFYTPEGILCEWLEEKIKDEQQSATRIELCSTRPVKGLPSLIEREISSKDGEGKLKQTIALTYDNRGNVIQKEVFDENGNSRKLIQKEFDESGREIYFSDSSGVEISKSYYPEEGMLREFNHSTGEISEIHYNFQGNIIHKQVQDRDDQIFHQKNLFDIEGRLLEKTDILGNKTKFILNDLGQTIKKIDPAVLDENDKEYCPTSTYKYDYAGNLVSFTDQQGRTIKTKYNSRGKPIRIIYPDETKETFLYYLDGSLHSYTDREGMTKTFTRDTHSRVTETEIVAAGEKIQETLFTDYSSPGKVKKTSSNGKMVEVTFDEAGECLSIQVGRNICLLKEKDHPSPFASASVAEEKEEQPFHTHFNYSAVNDRGQQVLEQRSVDESGKMMVTTFDALGRIEKVQLKNPLGHILSEKESRYDALGNRVKRIDKIISQGSCIGQTVTKWKYDINGNIIQKTEHVGSAEEAISYYAYDRGNHLISLTKPDGVSLHYEYYENGNLSRLSSSDGTIDYSYYYNNQNEIDSVVDAIHHNHVFLVRDENEHIVSEILGNGIELRNEYSDEGLRDRLYLPDGTAIAYEYEEGKLKAIKKIQSSGEVHYQYLYKNYNQSGQLITAEMINNLGALSITYDEKERTTLIDTPFWKEGIEYNESQISVINTENNFGKKTNTYEYDELGQLVRENDETYECDSIHNISFRNGKKTPVNQKQQVMQIDDEHYEYDKAGNVISTSNREEQTFFHYDALNRLTEVVTNDVKIVYSYDAFHRRTSRTLFTKKDQESGWQKEGVEYYLHDGDNEIGTLDEQNQIIQLRVLGLGHGAEIGAAVAMEIDHKLYAPIHDHRGSVTTLVDAKSGKVKESYQLTAFGEETLYNEEGIEIEGKDALNPWRFASKRVDPTTKLVHFGKREYCPKMCRWTTKDPLGSFDAPNPYAYGRCDPLTTVDLYGLFSISSVWKTISSATKSAANYVTDKILSCYDKKHPLENLYHQIDSFGESLLGYRYYRLSGFHSEKSHVGVFGNGELHDKYRITFINGILTTKEDQLIHCETISHSHNGNNVHYCYVGTRGWTQDLVHCLFSKLGVVSPEANALAKLWRELIKEMGGVDGGGIIFHYAHSLGGTETSNAKHLLSREEQKMIRVITFGSPTLIDNDGFHSVVNIVSYRDFVLLFDPVNFIYSLIHETENIILIGSPYDGFPLIDHLFNNYWDHLIINFWNEFEEIIDELI